MRDLLYTIAGILILGWTIGFLVLHASGFIHLLVVLAVIAILLGSVKHQDV